MEFLHGSMNDALRFIAERRLFAQMRKEAAAADRAGAAQNARQELGVLGVDEGTVNKSIGDLRSGQISPWRARRQLGAAVPGAGEQAYHVPHAVMTAAQQGRPADAAAQLDVLGLKALSPWSDNFNPLSAADAALAGGGAAVLQHKTQANRRLWQLLHGADEDAVTAMKSVLPEGLGKRWDRWRRASAVDPGILGQLGLTAPPRSTVVGGSIKMPAGAHGPPRPGHVPLEKLEAARQWKPKGKPGSAPGKPAVKSLLGSLGQLAVPAAAAVAPLAMHEWLGRGYRSGHKSISRLVDASKPETKK